MQIKEEKIDKIKNYIIDNCGNCGHWRYLQTSKIIREGMCKAHKIITTEQGWCKTHTAYIEEVLR